MTLDVDAFDELNIHGRARLVWAARTGGADDWTQTSEYWVIHQLSIRGARLRLGACYGLLFHPLSSPLVLITSAPVALPEQPPIRDGSHMGEAAFHISRCLYCREVSTK